MGNIYNSKSIKVAKINEEGEVHSTGDKHLGRVHGDGIVLDGSGHKVGHLDGAGKVFDLEHHIGSVHSDGGIFDTSGHHIGRAEPPHMEFGAAALLLLIR